MGGGAIQPDRSVFGLDGNYQRFEYAMDIEEAFDRTAKVFQEAGYRLDVADRATGEISGQRGRVGGASTDKGLKFYALILPASQGRSQVAVKVVQVIGRGSVINSTQTELIQSDGQMYQYLFRRIANVTLHDARLTPELPAAKP